MPLPDAANRPQPGAASRVIFDINKAPAQPDMMNHSLEKVARFLNLLGSAGVRPAAGDLVVIIHGPATDLVQSDAAYRRRAGVPNPNSALIAALTRAGVSIHVCGQALTGHRIPAQDVDPAITVDLSAMTTLAKYQATGWSLIPD